MASRHTVTRQSNLSRVGVNPKRSPALYLTFAIIVHAGAALLLYGLEPVYLAGDMQVSSRLTFIYVLAAYLYITFLFREKVWSFPSLFLLIASLFHLGLFVVPALSGGTPLFIEMNPSSSSWLMDSEQVGRAIYYVTVGVLCYSFGVTISQMSKENELTLRSSPLDRNLADDSETYRKYLAWTGSITLIASVSIWFLLSIQSIGLTFFLSPYTTFLQLTSDNALFTYAYLGISFGSAFIAFAPKKPLSVLALIFFAAFAGAALMIGMRDNVLIPAVAFVVVYAKIFHLRKQLLFFILVPAILIVISLVREIRAQGFGASADISDLVVSPLLAIEEMGYSLRVLVSSIGWHEVNGEPYYGGATYYAPFERAFFSLFGVPNIPASSDYRLMNVEIADRVGQIGGSVVAEAHHNFGLAGIVLVMILVGWIIGKSSTRATTPSRTAVLAVIAVVALMHIRNSFTPIPLWLVAGFSLIVISNTLRAISHRSRDVRLS